MIRRIYLTAVILAVALSGSAASAQSSAGVPVQITASKITVPLAQPPQQVISASAVVVGNPGPAAYYYWIVSNYLVGSSSPAGPFLAAAAPNTLSSSNYVQVSWAPAPGAISYDVLRTSAPGSPTGACNCAVATGVTGSSASDQSNSLLAYTVGPLDPGTLAWTLTNQAAANGLGKLSFAVGGAEKWSVDSSGALNAASIGGVRYANEYPGADIGAQVNAAIGTCPAAGCTVVIPSGDYTDATTIDITPFISLVGQGVSATTVTYTGAGDAVLVEAGSSAPYRNARIAHLSLVGTADNGTGILQVNSIGVEYEDLSVKDFGVGIAVDNEAPSYCANCGSGDSERTQFDGISFFENAVGLEFIRGSAAATNSVMYTWARAVHFQINNGQTGIALVGMGTADPISLQHSDFDFMANICLNEATGAPGTIVALTNGAQWYQGFVHAAAEQSCGTTQGIYWNIDGTSYLDAWGDYQGLASNLQNAVASGGTFIFGLYGTYVFGANANGQVGNGGLNTSLIDVPLTIGGDTGAGISGYAGISLAGDWSAAGTLNEAIEMGGYAGAVAGLGFDFGSSIQHPIAWSYTGDPIAFGWHSKVNATTPLSGAPLAWLTGDSPTSPYTAHSFAAAGYCFSANATCLSAPAVSGPVATALAGTSGSIGGTALAAGACTTGTAAVANSATAMAVAVSPSADPGTGFVWEGFVSATGTVTVRLCNITSGSLTPTAETYNVRVIQ